MDTLNKCIEKIKRGEAISTSVMVKFLEELKERRKSDIALEQIVRNMSDKLKETEQWCKNYRG